MTPKFRETHQTETDSPMSKRLHPEASPDWGRKGQMSPDQGTPRLYLRYEPSYPGARHMKRVDHPGGRAPMDNGTGKRLGNSMGAGTAIGAGLGVALGLALSNLALGIAIGISLGVALGAAYGTREVNPSGSPTRGARALGIAGVVAGILVLLALIYIMAVLH
jgi:hypothetical protein